MSENPNQFLTVAISAAKEAGAYLLDRFGSLTADAIDEKQRNDFVTVVDKTSEELILKKIRQHFPDHQILAEESGDFSSQSRFRWFIDPLDGTMNFIRNIPFYAVSIAVQDGDRMAAGVVYNPSQNELFTAARGQGAFLNEDLIHVSQEPDFSRAFLATGFPHHSKNYIPQFTTAFSEVFARTAGVRRLGSAALDLCYTACGRFEGFWELGLNPWDIAAGSLLVEEAGGKVSDFQGKSSFLDSGFIIAASAKTHPYIQNILSTHFKGSKS